MISQRGTKKQQARELLRLLEEGPSMTGESPEFSEQFKQHYRLWADTWIIPKVKRLLPDSLPTPPIVPKVFPPKVDCHCPSPVTGQLCTMGEGHAGPHKVGGPYHTVEEFVTQCEDTPCVYHENSKRTSVNTWERWLECIKCGHRKPKP